MRKIILTLITIIGVTYCLRFGYIWTAYGHGGQILGIPFAILIFGLTIAFFLSKKMKPKRIIFNLTIVIFMSLAGFSLTIEMIRKTMKNYFEFLYYEPEGWVNEIFLVWIIMGIIVYIGNEFTRRKQINDKIHLPKSNTTFNN